jgi:hypothetical protein
MHNYLNECNYYLSILTISHFIFISNPDRNPGTKIKHILKLCFLCVNDINDI